MSSLSDLAKLMESLAEEAEEHASDVAVEVALAMVNQLAYSTPVDTSEALSNWQISFAPITAAIPAHTEGEKGSTQRSSAQETVRRAQRMLANRAPGQTIYVGNAAPHIYALEYEGASPQNQFFAEAANAYGLRLARELT